MTKQIVIRLLGRFEVAVDGDVVDNGVRAASFTTAAE
jgi:hypothetical protein